MRIPRGGLPLSAADGPAASGAKGTSPGSSVALCTLVLLGVFGSILVWGSPGQEGAADRAAAGIQFAGFLGAGVSAVLLIAACMRSGTEAMEMPRAVPLILGANLVFPVLLDGIPPWSLPPAGMILAVYAYTCLVGSAWKALGPGRTLAFATVLASLCYIVFALTLQWQVQIWPTFVV
jgi:hypothetical protein